MTIRPPSGRLEADKDWLDGGVRPFRQVQFCWRMERRFSKRARMKNGLVVRSVVSARAEVR